jgi:hypothetical protein
MNVAAIAELETPPAPDPFAEDVEMPPTGAALRAREQHDLANQGVAPSDGQLDRLLDVADRDGDMADTSGDGASPTQLMDINPRRRTLDDVPFLGWSAQHGSSNT